MDFKCWTVFMDEIARVFPDDRKLPLEERVATTRDRIRYDWFAHPEQKRKDQFRVTAEHAWLKSRKPFYNVHPQLVPQLCQTNLDKIPASFIEIPGHFGAVNLRFAAPHSELNGAFGALFAKDDDGFILVADTGHRNRVDDLKWTICVTLPLRFHGEETIPEAYERIVKDLEQKRKVSADPEAPLTHFLAENLRDWYLNMFRLVATVGFLANCDDEILQRDVLSRDRRAFAEALANDDVEQGDRIAQRAVRRGKIGWNAGTNEMFAGEYPAAKSQGAGGQGGEHKWAHIRSGHPHAVRYGPGRTKVKIKWFRPTVVRPDLPFKSA